MAVRTPAEKALKPRLIGQPWVYCGIPESIWKEMRKRGLTPPPVKLPVAAHPRWRVDDLDTFIANLPTQEADDTGAAEEGGADAVA